MPTNEDFDTGSTAFTTYEADPYLAGRYREPLEYKHPQRLGWFGFIGLVCVVCGFTYMVVWACMNWRTL